MNTYKERFNQLRNEWLEAPDEATRLEVDQKIKDLAAEDREQFTQLYYEGAKEAIANAAKLLSDKAKDNLEPISKLLNWAYVADTYFGKTRSWFSNKLNGAIVNGKPSYFKREELNILADALRDISKKLEDVANNIHS